MRTNSANWFPKFAFRKMRMVASRSTNNKIICLLLKFSFAQSNKTDNWYEIAMQLITTMAPHDNAPKN